MADDTISAGQATSVEIPEDVFKTVQTQYLSDAMDVVRKRAMEFAAAHNRTSVNYVDLVRAFEQRFSGGAGYQPLPLWRENLFLIIVVVMTVIFGLMGLLPYLLGNAATVGYKPDFFLDIAKLFAGVVVGGAAGAANAAAASRRAKG